MDTVTINASDVDSFKKDSVQLNFLDAINFAIPEIDSLTEKIKAKKESLESELLQFGEYSMYAAEAKEVLEKRKKAKRSAMLQPICQEYIVEIKDLRSDLKRTKSVLSQTIVQYADTTGATEVRGPDGHTLAIVKTAHLSKIKKHRVASKD